MNTRKCKLGLCWKLLRVANSVTEYEWFSVIRLEKWDVCFCRMNIKLLTKTFDACCLICAYTHFVSFSTFAKANSWNPTHALFMEHGVVRCASDWYEHTLQNRCGSCGFCDIWSVLYDAYSLSIAQSNCVPHQNSCGENFNCLLEIQFLTQLSSIGSRLIASFLCSAIQQFHLTK